VVVVRYFGGIKLGTGGLVRAYGQSVNEVLATLPLETVVAKQQVTLSVPHHLTGELEGLIRQFHLPVTERLWEADFTIHCELTAEQTTQLTQALGRFAGQYQLDIAD